MANATQTIAGDIKLAGDLGGNNNAASPALVDTTVTPGSYTLAGVTVDSKGRLTAAANGTVEQLQAIMPIATTTSPGAITIGAGLSVDSNGLVSLNAPWATYSTKGIIQVGEGLSVTDGVLSFQHPDATTISKGLVQIGSGLSVTNGIVDLDAPDATKTSKGVVQIGDGIDVAAGVISVATATSTVKGVVSIGSGLDVNAGEVSWTQPAYPDATTVAPGVVRIGDNIDVAAGVISVKTATSTDLGLVSVQAGGGLSVTGGVLSFDGSLADATYTTKGLVQVQSGGGITITGGVISLTNNGDATKLAKGIVQVGTNIDVTAGEISVKTGSATELGLVRVGTNIDVTAGEISVKTATTGQLGLVRVGTNIDVTAGEISVKTGSETELGLLRVGAGLSATSGIISVDSSVARTNTANNFTRTISSTAFALTDGASINVNAFDSNTFTVTLGGNRALANPANLAPGSYTFVIKQDATGSRTLSFGSAYKFKSGFSKTLSTTANAIDVVTCLSDGTNLYCTLSKGYA